MALKKVSPKKIAQQVGGKSGAAAKKITAAKIKPRDVNLNFQRSK